MSRERVIATILESWEFMPENPQVVRMLNDPTQSKLLGVPEHNGSVILFLPRTEENSKEFYSLPRSNQYNSVGYVYNNGTFLKFLAYTDTSAPGKRPHILPTWYHGVNHKHGFSNGQTVTSLRLMVTGDEYQHRRNRIPIMEGQNPSYKKARFYADTINIHVASRVRPGETIGSNKKISTGCLLCHPSKYEELFEFIGGTPGSGRRIHAVYKSPYLQENPGNRVLTSKDVYEYNFNLQLQQLTQPDTTKKLNNLSDSLGNTPEEMLRSLEVIK